MKLGSVFIFASLLLGGYAWSMHRHALMPRVLHFDAYLSASEQDAIARDSAFAQCLTEKYPSIRLVKSSAHPDRHEMVIQSWHPIAKINTDNLLAENGSVISAHSYHESILQTLPMLQVPQIDRMGTEQLVACVQNADAATWSAGTVTWMRPSRIEFQLIEPEVSMVCTSEQLKETSKFLEAVRKVWLQHPADKFDVRFEKQVVAFGNMQNLKKVGSLDRLKVGGQQVQGASLGEYHG